MVLGPFAETKGPRLPGGNPASNKNSSTFRVGFCNKAEIFHGMVQWNLAERGSSSDCTTNPPKMVKVKDFVSLQNFQKHDRQNSQLKSLVCRQKSEDPVLKPLRN
jgi:hypothetical protein